MSRCLSRLMSFAALLGVGLLGPVALAQDDAPAPPAGLTHESTFDMESIRSPSISPDGAQIIFSRGFTNKKEDRGASNLWIVDTQGADSGGRIRELTHGDWRDSSPVWSPDGARIAFISNRDSTSQIHVMWLDTREVAQLTHVEQSPSGLTWSPDGKQLAFTMFVPDKESPLKVKLPSRPEGAKWAEPAIVVDRISWQRDGSGYQKPGYRHIYTVDAIVGGTPRKVTEGDYDHGGAQWAADGGTMFVSGIRKPDAEYLRGDSEIYAIDMESLEFTTLTEREGPDGGHQVSPDGKHIAYTGFDQQNFTSHLSSLYLMNADGTGKKTLAAGLANSPGSVTWAKDGSGVYFTMGADGAYNIHFCDLAGKVSPITQGAQVIRGFTVSNDGQFAATRSTFHQPGDLVTFHKYDPGNMTSLVDVNKDILDGVALGDVEELNYTSSDGLPVQGWLIKPINFDASKEYPMLLWIHGGPWSMYTVGFNWAWQQFAAEGYAVLYVNPRGSTGYGQDFVNGIQFSYPGKDYDDLMAGLDEALKRDWIDERNLFVCGGSGGGVLTAWIVGHTDRFTAAVSMRPVINWHSFVGNTDGGSWYHQFEKFPWENPKEYFDRSPLSYVGNVTTPTMLMTGESDLRTPMPQSEEYYRALKMLKKDTLLVRMPNEYHGWRRPSHRLLQQLYLQAWFEKYMVGDEVEGEEIDAVADADNSDD